MYITFEIFTLCSKTIVWIIGVVAYHRNQPYIITNTNGEIRIMPAYPPLSPPQYFSSAINYQSQVNSTIHFNRNSENLTQNAAEAVQDGTRITYSNQEPPLPYEEKENC